MTEATLTQLETLQESTEYADFLMCNCADRIICNGATLLDAIEDGHMFDKFLTSIGLISS
jgi:hypothetical protein